MSHFNEARMVSLIRSVVLLGLSNGVTPYVSDVYNASRAVVHRYIQYCTVLCSGGCSSKRADGRDECLG